MRVGAIRDRPDPPRPCTAPVGDRHRLRSDMGDAPSIRRQASARAISAPTRLPAPVTIAVRSCVHGRAPIIRRCRRSQCRSDDLHRRHAREPPADRASRAQPCRAPGADRRAPPAARSTNGTPTVAAIPGMRIARDGTWYHEGAPIRRPAMVRLFSTVLRREPDGRHMLVTPVEKLEIEVDATAFRAVEMESEGEGERAPHRVSARQRRRGDPWPRPSASDRSPDEHGPSPRVLVRHGLEAELARPVYYELAEIALAEGHEPPGIWSDGAFFPLEQPRTVTLADRLRAALERAAVRTARSPATISSRAPARHARRGADRDHRPAGARASS